MIQESYDFNYYETLGLAHWLGFERAKKFLHNFLLCLIILIFLEALLIVTKLNDISPLFHLIPTSISFIIFVISISQNYIARKNEYFKTVENYYNEFLKEYEGYTRIIVGFKSQTINKKIDNNFIMLTNGYKFIFLVDPLKGTKYYFKDKTNLKVTGENESYKLEFSTVNIKKYYLTKGEDINYVQKYNTYINLDNDIKKIIVELDDFTTLEISANAYKYFKESNPLKEIYDED